MVVFTCGYCGESVQKPKVEKHYLTKCRNKQPNLSCMDCFKDFMGNDYEGHTKCITEAERYSGKGFQAKEKKGEKKQNAWVDMVQSVLEEQKSAPRNVLRIIEAICQHNNTPRKKPKFINFVKNVCGHKTNIKDIDQAWDLISVKLSALSNANQNGNRSQSTAPVADDNDGDQVNGNEEKPVTDKEDTLNASTDNNPSEESNKEKNDGDAVPQDNINQNGNTETGPVRKLSKKERKEEKKRIKYEAELQSANVVPQGEEGEEDEGNNKKGKKKKNKSESENLDDEETEDDDKTIKKRKRQDTTNSVHEVPDSTNDDIENEPVVLTKAQKKKLKLNSKKEAEESLCLHDQNVAKIEELSMKSEKFNWHAVIVSVLEKKGNELPFKRLQKKVLSEYCEATGREIDDRIAEKFIKRLKSAPNVRVDKMRVLLITD